MLTHEEFKARMLEDPEVLAEYARLRSTQAERPIPVGTRNKAGNAQADRKNPKNSKGEPAEAMDSVGIQ
ncbi:MAG: hypothetical protein KKG92_11970 [Gammaproteobacteria bacterium]|nr:hypothetical protein [Gammaproteobacteria bacterium]